MTILPKAICIADLMQSPQKSQCHFIKEMEPKNLCVTFIFGIIRNWWKVSGEDCWSQRMWRGGVNSSVASINSIVV